MGRQPVNVNVNVHVPEKGIATFDHEKLDVYKASMELVILANEIIEAFPRGKSYLIDQLARASSSITLNIAEGAGEFADLEKRRFYRMARRSATECAAIFDLCLRLELASDEQHLEGKKLLLRIVSMLTKLVR